MLKTLTGQTALELHKQEILLRCEQDRLKITAGLQDLDSRTRWQQLAGQLLLLVAPKLRLLMPVAGFLISKKIVQGSKTANWMTGLSTLVSLFKSFRSTLNRARN